MATQGRTSARYPLHARLSPQDSVALLQKRKVCRHRCRSRPLRAERPIGIAELAASVFWVSAGKEGAEHV